MPKDAERSAREALEYLDRFDRPAGYSKQSWKQVERQLRASCYYVLAKAAAVRATAARNADGRKYWWQARALLAQSREYNPEDPLAAYLFGLAEQSLGRTEDAALQFADSTSSDNPVKARALEKLRRIHASGTVKTVTSFEDYVALISPNDFSGNQRTVRVQVGA